MGCNNSSIRIYSIAHEIISCDILNIILPLVKVIPLPFDFGPCQLVWNTFENHELFLSWLLPNGIFGVYDFLIDSIIFSSCNFSGPSLLHWLSPDLLAVTSIRLGIEVFSLKEKQIIFAMPIPELKFPGIPMAITSHLSLNNEFVIDIVTQPFLKDEKSKFSRPAYIRASVLTSLEDFSILVDFTDPLVSGNEGVVDSEDEYSSIFPSSYFGIAGSPITGCFIATLSG